MSAKILIKKRGLQLVFVFILLVVYAGCSPDENEILSSDSLDKKNRHVVLVVIDGPRYSDTWGNNSPNNPIPYQKELLKTNGVFFDHFFNNGITLTLPGHSAITTGNYSNVINNGDEYPDKHSIFQTYLSETKKPPNKACIVTSKSKLKVLANTKDLEWKNSFRPSIDAIDRTDKETLESAINILQRDAPNLILIHFREPDSYGHGNKWTEYMQSIRNADRYVAQLYEFIQSDLQLRDKTTMLITNDHGRHSDGIGTGFVDHGDGCPGCRHISLLALGSNIKGNQIINKEYEQVDLAPTIASILGLSWKGEGQPIQELLKVNESN